jgi:hypothetical protein
VPRRFRSLIQVKVWVRALLHGAGIQPAGNSARSAFVHVCALICINTRFPRPIIVSSRRSDMEPQFEFWRSTDGTWSWAGVTPGGTPVEQHGLQTLLHCVVAAGDYGFSGELDTFVIDRSQQSGRHARGSGAVVESPESALA